MNHTQISLEEPFLKISSSPTMKHRAFVERNARTVVKNQLDRVGIRKPTGKVPKSMASAPSSSGMDILNRSKQIRTGQSGFTLKDLPDVKAFKKKKEEDLINRMAAKTNTPEPHSMPKATPHPTPAKASFGNKLIKPGLALAGAGALAYGAKKLYDKHKENESVKTAMFIGFVDEMTKIAEAHHQEHHDPNQEKEPPAWAKRMVNIGGFAVGAGIGAYTGDIIARKALKITDPKIKNIARASSAAVSGIATAMIAPRIKKKIDEIVRGD